MCNENIIGAFRGILRCRLLHDLNIVIILIEIVQEILHLPFGVKGLADRLNIPTVADLDRFRPGGLRSTLCPAGGQHVIVLVLDGIEEILILYDVVQTSKWHVYTIGIGNIPRILHCQVLRNMALHMMCATGPKRAPLGQNHDLTAAGGE